VLGGVRSGKSEVAERLAGAGPGTYLATGLVAPDDDDFADRVARHRARRPPAWPTVEEPRAVPGVLARLHGPVLLDALGTWVANEPRPDIDALVEALVSRRGDTVIVSEEVGLGVHPMTEIGRQFADRLGEANRRVAEVADRCLLVVAGRVIDLPGGDSLASPTPTVGPTARPEVPVSDAESGQPTGPDGGFLQAVAGQPTGPKGGFLQSLVGQPTRPGRGFLQAAAFLTPIGRGATPTPDAFVWFPLVGALLGFALGGLWWLLDDNHVGLFVPALLAAAIVVVADLALTGALHFDGLLDSADGLLPHLRRERRLAVMADPHVGAFAFATGAAVLLLRTTALAVLLVPRPFLLASLWALSRTAMAVTALTGRYARSHGLASSFVTGAGSWVVPGIAGAVLSLVLALADDPESILAVIAAALAAAGVAWLAQRRIDGFTGDTLGAGGIVAETAGLVIAAMVLSA
jgi:cobalamin 5'-phosphate synthase/cobalamin synthase